MESLSTSMHDRPRHAPSVPSPPWSALLAFRRDPLRFLMEAVLNHGDVAQFRLGRVQVCIASRPEHVKHVLIDARAKYDKKTRGYDTLREFLGNGLLTSEGEFWRRQRRIAQPAFHKQRIAGFVGSMVQATDNMLERWQLAAQRHEAIDAAHEMTRLTLQIAGETLLGSDMGGVEDRVGDAVGFLNTFANQRILSVFSPPLSWPIPAHKRFKQAAETLNGIVAEIIRRRRRDNAARDDLLGMFMEARDEDTGEGMSDGQLRDEVMTMFLAGHETTANALAWTLYLVSLHPEVAARLRAEVAEVLGGRIPTSDDVERLVYAQQVFKESMRLYPPVWSLARRATEDDILDGYRIRKDSLVILSPYVTHRHPAFWPNPVAFDPQRFAPEREKERPRLAYFPFGAGPRVCIGQSFAMMEGVVVLARVLQRFTPWLVPGHPVALQPLITLRPRHGLRFHLEPAT